MKSPAVYIRVSTKEQAEQGKYSLESQVEACQEKLRQLGFPAGKLYGDTYSGQSSERPGTVYDRQGQAVQLPGMTQLLEDASSCSVVVMYDRTRLGRKVSVSAVIRQQLADQGVTIRYVHGDITEDPDSNLVIDAMGDVMSAMEVRNFMRRTYPQKRRRVKEKRLFQGGPPPFGYRHVGKDKPLEQIPEDVAQIKQMGRLFLQGKPIEAIANNPSFRDRKGLRFHPKSVWYILRNPFYAGYVTFGWREGKDKDYVRGLHQPVWSEKEWHSIQAEWTRRQQVKGRGVSSPHIFSGIVFCESCKRPMHIHTRMNSQAVSFYCRSRYRNRRGLYNCLPNNIPATIIRQRVEQQLYELATQEFIEQSDIKPEIDLAEALENRLGVLKRQEINLWSLQSAQGSTASEAFYASLETVTQEIEAIQAKLVAARNGYGKPLSMQERQQIMRNAFAGIEDFKALLTPPFEDVLALRAVLRELVPAIWVREGQIVGMD